MIQIDGTAHSNCGAGLQEQVSVSPIESVQAVAVRFSPLWAGAALGILLVALTKQYRMRSELPFAPFLVLGTTLAFFFDLHILLLNL